MLIITFQSGNQRIVDLFKKGDLVAQVMLEEIQAISLLGISGPDLKLCSKLFGSPLAAEAALLRFPGNDVSFVCGDMAKNIIYNLHFSSKI